MNDFVAFLVAAASFCGSYVALGLLSRLLILVRWAPAGLEEGSFVQLALAAGLAVAAWRRMVRTSAAGANARHA